MLRTKTFSDGPCTDFHVVLQSFQNLRFLTRDGKHRYLQRARQEHHRTPIHGLHNGSEFEEPVILHLVFPIVDNCFCTFLETHSLVNLVLSLSSTFGHVERIILTRIRNPNKSRFFVVDISLCLQTGTKNNDV